MKTIFIILAFANLITGATYKETREVTDSKGKKFTCNYSLFYNTKTVSKSKSSVSCTPNTAGKVVSEEFIIESLGKTVTVKHSIKKGKDIISAVSLKDYVSQTTAAPTTAAPAPPPVSGEAMSMDCTCKLPGMDNTAAGRNGFPYLMKGHASSDRKIMKPSALSRGGGYHGGYYGGGVSTGGSSLISSIIPLAVVALLAGLAAFGASGLLSTLFPTMVAIIGRSLPVDELAATENIQATLLAKLNDRQLFGNLGNLGNFGNLGNLGNLGNIGAPAPAPAPAPTSPLLGLLGGSNGGSIDLASLLGAAGGSSGSNDVVNQIAMQIAQQQLDSFLNNGGAEAALTDMVESGKLEEMINTMTEKAMENINTEEIMANMQKAMENVNTEEIIANIQSNMEESMSGANDGLEEIMAGVNSDGLLAGANLQEMMAGMNMTEMLNGMNLNSMEMEMKCSCVPSA